MSSTSSTLPSFLRPGSKNSSWNSVFDFSDLTVDLQRHLFKVYSLVGLGFAVASVGCFLSMKSIIPPVVGIVVMFSSLMGLVLGGCVGLSIRIRAILYGGFAFGKGASLSPLILAAFDVAGDYSLVFRALVGTTAIFLCLSGSAYYAQRRSMFWLGSFLSMSILSMLFLSIVNIFARSEFITNIFIYFGLIVFCGYVLFDTQMIIERFHAGDQDFVVHALDLFIDFVAIFVRILIILIRMKKSEKK